jgi:hypothetical protein
VEVAVTVTTDVLTGIAQLIADAGLGSWNPGGIYALTDTGVFLKTMPDGTGVPDRCVTLNLIPVTANVSMPFGQYFLQVACRGQRNKPLDVDDIADPIFDILQGLTGQTFGVTRIAQLRFVSGTPMGQDSNVRWERADRYMADINTAPTILRPSGGSWD